MKFLINDNNKERGIPSTVTAAKAQLIQLMDAESRQLELGQVGLEFATASLPWNLESVAKGTEDPNEDPRYGSTK